jgi:hypothetical protein
VASDVNKILALNGAPTVIDNLDLGAHIAQQMVANVPTATSTSVPAPFQSPPLFDIMSQDGDLHVTGNIVYYLIPTANAGGHQIWHFCTTINATTTIKFRQQRAERKSALHVAPKKSGIKDDDSYNLTTLSATWAAAATGIEQVMSDVKTAMQANTTNNFTWQSSTDEGNKRIQTYKTLPSVGPAAVLTAFDTAVASAVQNLTNDATPSLPTQPVTNIESVSAVL